jgi:hypothetical protein
MIDFSAVSLNDNNKIRYKSNGMDQGKTVTDPN